jgi:hypothetical protein
MPRMPLRFALLLSCLACASAIAADAPRDPRAAQLLQASMRAMGGCDLLRSIDAVEIAANARRSMVEQSIRPEGPWIEDLYRLDATLDFAHGRLHARESRAGNVGWLAPPEQPWPPVDYVVVDGVAVARDGDAPRPYSQAAVQDAEEWLALNPLRILLTAERGAHLHAESDVVRHDAAQHVLAWTWQGTTVRAYLDADSALPSAVEWTRPRPRDVFWNAWGDVASTLAFENWSLRPGGLRVPTQWELRRNGLPERNLQLTSLTLSPRVDAAVWDVPQALRRKIADAPRDVDDVPLGTPAAPASEPAPGVVKIAGRWDVAFVRQHDGVVVIEAPIGNGYSQRVLAEAERRFPGVPIKAVVTTSDAWPHIAGLREYVARGVPAYLLDRNRAIVERLLAAPHAQRPDALQRAPRTAILHAVSERTAIGSGDERIELLPLRTATGERQMLVWLPRDRLMYTSDLVQPASDGDWYAPEMLLELRQRFVAARVRPLRCFGMHYGATAWADMDASLTRHLSGPLAKQAP